MRLAGRCVHKMRFAWWLWRTGTSSRSRPATIRSQCRSIIAVGIRGKHDSSRSTRDYLGGRGPAVNGNSRRPHTMCRISAVFTAVVLSATATTAQRSQAM
jgi:hypothetical protein